MADVPIDKSHFIGLVVGLILFGIYTCLFAVFLWWANHEKSRPHHGVMSTLVLLYTISSGVAVCWVIDNTFAFLRDRETIGTLNYFISPTNIFYPIKVMCYVLAMAMADCLFAWRLYIVFDRRKYLLLFTVPLFVVGAGTGLVLVVYGFKGAQVGDYRYNRMKSLLGIVAMSTSVLFNILSTSLIAGRLWHLGRNVDRVNGTSGEVYKRIAGVIIDSGVIYTATMIAFIVLGGFGLPGAQNLVLYLVPMVVGIVPTLMVIRLNLAQTANSFKATPSSERTAISTLHFVPNPNLVSQTETMEIQGATTSITVPAARPSSALIDS